MPKIKTFKPARQIVLWIAANAGGVGKTTLGIHIGYKFAQLGLKVLFIDLDTNGSLARFCGLESDLKPELTTAALFDRNFDGNYPIFTPEWGNPQGRFDTCLGGDVMLGVALDLPTRTGRELILKKAFKKYPTDYDLIILDSPASLDVLSYAALAVATHILIPLPMSIKLSGIDSLLKWIRMETEALDLTPPPTLIGGVPMRVATSADQQAFGQEIADVLDGQSVPCFPSVRFSSEFENASNRGMAPLYLYRPKHPACQDFQPIVDELTRSFQVTPVS
ncbi:ParA family protein [Chamaesiphon minutus]|uniref:ATPase involved in chromosome partitioning n=1 Tax=Chamaesiphon minutus (strain ATCC 27169 / PCC 6605) TaxID=1173020 RepID=K9UDR8_CHAP6|nr:ParA family protein [Chamaesiphon minutus]AFY92773.1 ATPase involved in chromosome partitioning [Chamaesiphon minutus PCC 6605]